MQMGIDYGREHVAVEVRADRLLPLRRPPVAPALADPGAAVRRALETPTGFPALRRALTPGDHVTIIVDPQLPRLAELLTPILEHVVQAQVDPGAITLLCPPLASAQGWLDDLPDGFNDVQVEVHDPGDRKRLSYLASTRQGRRLYLNRTAVDADQLVILARCGYDPLLGYAGAEGALFPALSDEATRKEMWDRLSLTAPGEKPRPARQEALEVAWLLGAPFCVHVIEGAGEDIAHVVGGLTDTGAEAHRLQDARWRGSVGRPAATVVASVGGDPARHGFTELARALACAARVVEPNGRIILLTQAEPELGPASALLRQADNPGRALDLLRQHRPPDMAAAFQWVSSVQKAQVYLLSGLPAETAEELLTVPLEHVRQVQRLVDAAGSCLFLADAHKLLAVVDGMTNDQ
jgi:nickel-dependent lactate racemase